VTKPFLPLMRAHRFGAPAPTGPTPFAHPRFAVALSGLVQVQADARTVLAQGAAGAGGLAGDPGDGRVIATTGLDRIIAFDASAGRLRAQAGMSLLDAQGFLAERGHFLPVCPPWGPTTLGGAVAVDAHAANHEANGTFGAFVRALRLHRSDRPAVVIGPTQDPDLFAATIGGLGLTGVIEWVEVETRPIRSSMMDWEATPFRDAAEFLNLMAEGADWVHRRAWFDPRMPGRGRFERFRHAQDGPREARAPQPLIRLGQPVSRGLTNGALAGLVTGLMQRRGAGARMRDYASVFFPFEDSVEGLAHLFGKRGALTYQCVLPPKAAGAEQITAFLNEVKRLVDGPTMVGAVAFGTRVSPALLSFPKEGLCLTVRTRAGARAAEGFARLDGLVLEAGGKINPAADARASAVLCQAALPLWREAAAWRDPSISSALALLMEAP
jgi:FAD/FMN-containing dehydrogenase